MVGCNCPVCKSDDPYNKRLRPSGLLNIDGKRLLIDSGPDFRYQALTHQIEHLDGVLLTHTHYDHVSGLDELRAFYMLHRTVLPVLVSLQTLESLKKRYDYLFAEKAEGVSLAAQLHFQVLENSRGTTEFCDVPLQYISYEQGGTTVNGYRFGKFAYVSDICNFPDSVYQDLSGVELLVMSALRHEPSPVHLTIDEAIAFSTKVGAKQTYFTHIAHEVDHQQTSAKLPANFHLSYDNLTLELP